MARTVRRPAMIGWMTAVLLAGWFALAGPVASAATIGYLGPRAVGDEYGGPLADLIARHRAAFDTGSIAPLLDEAEADPGILLRLSEFLDTDAAEGVAPDRPVLDPWVGLAMWNAAETEEQAAFALGMLSRIALQLLAEELWVPKVLTERDGGGTGPDDAMSLAGSLIDARLLAAHGDALRASLRDRPSRLWHDAIARLRSLGSGVRSVGTSRAELLGSARLIESRADAAIGSLGSSGGLLGAIQQLATALGGGAIASPDAWSDTPMFLRLAAEVVQDWIRRGPDSHWLGAPHTLGSPRPRVAASLHGPDRSDDASELPRNRATANPGLAILDAWIETSAGTRVDQAAPPAGANGSARYTLVVRVLGWQPVSDRLRLTAIADRSLGTSPTIAQREISVELTPEDVVRGVSRELRLPFTVSAAEHGPFDSPPWQAHTQGVRFSVEAYVPYDVTAPVAGRWFRILRPDPSTWQRLQGWRTYETWPYGLEFDSAGRSGRARRGNRPYPTFATGRPDGFAITPHPWLLPAPRDTDDHGRIYEPLTDRPADAVVFFVPEGGSPTDPADWAEEVRRTDRLVAVIGADWLQATPDNGPRRLAYEAWLADRYGLAPDRITYVVPAPLIGLATSALAGPASSPHPGPVVLLHPTLAELDAWRDALPATQIRPIVTTDAAFDDRLADHPIHARLPAGRRADPYDVTRATADGLATLTEVVNAESE